MATLTPRELRATLDDDSCSGQFLLRRMDPDRDVDLVHSWMNDAEVARFWEMPWPRERIASYLLEQHRSVDSAAYLGELDGVAMSYWVTYRADLPSLPTTTRPIHTTPGCTCCWARPTAADAASPGVCCAPSRRGSWSRSARHPRRRRARRRQRAIHPDVRACGLPPHHRPGPAPQAGRTDDP